jgi:hypothetical protein
VRKFLESRDLKNVEYLPVKILDHKGKVASEDYVIVHPIKPQDCLDLEKSEPEYNLINEDKIDEVKRMVIDEERLDPEILLFRIKDYSKDVIIRRELAKELHDQGYGGLGFKKPRR